MSEFYFSTTIGIFKISAQNDCITNLELTKETKLPKNPATATPLIKTAIKQLNEYLSGTRKTFDLPLEPTGTAFQKSVWSELQRIPYGTTLNYKQLAQNIGNPNAARAVGNANNKNPIIIFIPCHRVIGKNGSLTGFAAGLDVKEKLLELEK